ncbi:MAG TPA: hypothetical protein VFP56_03015 [Candidatus Limnocylindrales bacterium]|nr:hypothetical protein [Candidatus Limnocylindrales bacterium]
MPDPHPRRASHGRRAALDRRASLGRLIAAWLVILVAGAAPLAATASEASLPSGNGVVLAAPPDETCTPGATFGAGGFEVCSPPSVGNPGPGFNLGGLLPILGGVVLGAGLALAVAYLVLRRRAGAPLDPVDAGEWWTCRNCGRNNVVGSPRCYSCGTWQG